MGNDVSDNAFTRRHRISLGAAVAVIVVLSYGLAAPPAQSAPAAEHAAASAGPPKHVFPTVEAARARRAATTSNPGNLLYHGGPVVTGPPRVYLVFWGSQWGTGTAQTGFSNDASGVATRLVQLFQGLGAKVNGSPEKFSNTLKWYCSGTTLFTDGLQSATGCPSQPKASHVGYPTGGALIGIVNDTGSAEPQSATQAQLAAEADHAAGITGDLQANTQYVIASAHGVTPNGFNTTGVQWCAWHSYSDAATPVSYTNMPYLPDAGTFCGAGFVNGDSGPLDGITIVGGHEYSETVTDPRLNAWYDGSGNENGDKCAWVSGDANPKANAQNVTLSTGTFPFQSEWMNSAVYNGVSGSCAISSPK